MDRLVAVGNLAPALSVPKEELQGMYEERSLLTHGLPFGKLDERRKGLYRSQERLLRGIIQKALLEPAFRDVFASDESVAAHLPLR